MDLIDSMKQADLMRLVSKKDERLRVTERKEGETKREKEGHMPDKLCTHTQNLASVRSS